MDEYTGTRSHVVSDYGDPGSCLAGISDPARTILQRCGAHTGLCEAFQRSTCGRAREAELLELGMCKGAEYKQHAKSGEWHLVN
jgi:hypothetical protein